MNHTPAQSSHRKIFDLSLEFMDPQGAERAMTKNLESKLKVQSKIILKDQMMCLKHTGSDEVQSLASKVVKKIRFNKNEVSARIINFIMNLKIEDIRKDIKEEKCKVTKNQKELDDIVRPKTIVSNEYRTYVKKNSETTWMKEKGKVKERVSHLKKKNLKRLRKVTPKKTQLIYKGVKVSDKFLEESDCPPKVKIQCLSKERTN